jgi:hypothetical protein
MHSLSLKPENGGSIFFLNIYKLESDYMASHTLNKLIYKIKHSDTNDVLLREEHRLKLFENRVLRRIFGPKRHEMIRG